MKLKSKLPPFSLIHISCQHTFCFWFSSLIPLSKFWYICWQTTHTGLFKFHIWDRVLCRLTWNCHWAVWQDFWSVWYGDWTVSSRYGFLGFDFKYQLITLWKSMQILFTDGTTKSITLKTENYGGLCVWSSRFCPSLTGLAVLYECQRGVQIESQLRWQLAASCQWAITCWISQCSHFVYGDAAVWLKCAWHQKMQYLRKLLQEAQPRLKSLLLLC